MGGGSARCISAPDVCVDCLRVSFGRIACGWLVSLGRIVRGCITEIGRGGACVPARVPHKGVSIVQSPRTMRIFLDGNAATRMFGRAHRHRPYGFVWVDCAWVVLFVCWENGAHEPTPSVLYFCQPRVADDRRLPWGKSYMNQHHRCCTFDSPGLPTIGGYPG